MGSTTRKRESPQLAFCLLSVALKARTCESEKDISGFRADSFYPPTQPLFTPTLPPTQKWDTLLFCGTTEDHPYSKKPTPGREVGLQESLRDLLNTERVCVHIEGKHTLSDLLGRLLGISRKFQQHFQQHNQLKITGISSLSVLPSRASKTTSHHSTSGCLTAPFPAKASTAALLPSHPSAPSAKSSRYPGDQSAP